MKKYYSFLFAVVILVFTSCGDTTDHGKAGDQNSIASDSAVGNSDAANTIYRDSADIRAATESGGGTANPSNKGDTAVNDTAR